MSNFYNRCVEQGILKKNIEKGIRVNVIYSSKGCGKSTLISHILEDSSHYIHVSNEELVLKEHADDYYFLKSIAEKVSEAPFGDEIRKFKAQASNVDMEANFSLNLLGFGVGVSIPLSFSRLQASLIELLKSEPNKVFLHIENMQKIDIPSLNFLVKLVDQTPNVFLFLEYSISNHSSVVQDSSSVFEKLRINPEFIELDKLKWKYVCDILHDLSLNISPNIQKEYLSLDGDLKSLLFKHRREANDIISLEKDERFVLTFIELANSELCFNEIFEIIDHYPKSELNFSKGALQQSINKLHNNDLIFFKDDNICIREYGLQYADKSDKLLATEMLATYYIPIIEDVGSSCLNTKIKGLRILLDIFIKTKDGRLNILLPYISKYISPLMLNKKTVDSLCKTLKENSGSSEVMYILMQIYTSMGCYSDVSDNLQSCTYGSPALHKILYITALIHTKTYSPETESLTLNFIEAENDKTCRSALYTCLISLYMKTKSTKFVLEYVSSLYGMEDVLTEQDKMIINKNISIYHDTKTAISMIVKAIIYFKKNKMNRFRIASHITLATRYAQSGNVKRALSLLKIIRNSSDLTQKDLIYIDNNIAVIDFYTGNVGKSTYNSLKEADYCLEDEYTKMLAVNNLLVYHTSVEEYDKALEYAQQIENVGFEKFAFDEYLHLSYLNLYFYYSRTGNREKSNLYMSKLQKLRDNCCSTELKKYISKNLHQMDLEPSDKWYFMSEFNFRPAFMGHWMINTLDR